MAERRSVIVTFKPKDERPDGDRDKLDILSEVTESRLHVLDANRLALGASLPPAVAAEALAYDVDEFEAPIVTASLTDSEIEALRADGNVLEVEEDGEMHALGVPSWSAASAIQRGEIVVEGQPTPQAETLPAGVSQIKAPQGWGCSQGKNIKVAILDTGIDKTHPDLAPNYKGGISFVAAEGTPEDFNGHGTHCAGTVAAAVNGSGVIGVAPLASLYAVKVLAGNGSGAWSNLINGIDWGIKHKMRILSMSLGSLQAPPNAVKTMCQTAWNKGLLLVAAAGNDGPADDTVGFPAKYDTVIAVSAIDSANAIASFSSRGPDVELCAPGVQVLSTLPGNTFGKLNGTSMACPHVSGAAAMAWGGHRFADNATIRRLLARTSDPLGAAGRDKLFGFGRVDAAQAACALTPPPPIKGLP